MISAYRYVRKKQAESQKQKNTELEQPSTHPTDFKPCAHRSEPIQGPCPECQAQNRWARKYRWKIILGLFFPYALQALDSTIIASALPWIASDFGEVSQLNWIISAFNLTSAAFIPFWAQMADIFGRNATLNITLIFMLVGSALCTGAPTTAFPVLLLGRGFQGLAAAGINVVVRTILADRVSLAENARNWSVFALTGGISYALGPVIGGYLTSADWRWCFAINLPIGVVAIGIVFLVLRKELLGPQPIPELDETSETGRREKLAARLQTIDVGGQLLFLFGFGLIVLGLTWGGATYPWDSAAVLVPLIVGVILTVAFCFWEHSMAPGNVLSEKWPWQRPMIPWKILTHKDICLLFFTETTSGMALYAILYFTNIYFISVKGYSSDKAGVQLLYFTPGIGGGVIASSLLCNRWPRMTWPPIFFGTLVEAAGVGMMAYAMWTENTSTVYGMMALTGVGVGLRFMAAPLHGVGLFRKNRASVIGLLAVCVPLGGSLGLTIMSTVFNNTSGLDSDATDFSEIQNQPDSLRDAAIENAKMGCVWAFVSITPLLVLSFFCSMLLGNIKLGQGSTDEDDDGSNNIIFEGIYLLGLLRGKNMLDEESGMRLKSAESEPTEYQGATSIPMTRRSAELS